MSDTITVRLTREIAAWLEETASRTGQPQGRIIREQLEKARAGERHGFLRLAGTLSGPSDLSTRKGFAKK